MCEYAFVFPRVPGFLRQRRMKPEYQIWIGKEKKTERR